MICPNCGTRLQSDARFCTRCAAALVVMPAPAPVGWLKALARFFGGSATVVAEPPPPRTTSPEPLLSRMTSPEPFPPSREAPPHAFPDRDARSVPLMTPPPPLPYRLNDKFLTRAEASFFRVLQLAPPDGVLLCPKVNLQDLFWAPPNDYTARNRIDRKHVDFVLASSETLRPLCGIELDDRSHQRPDRQERDRFVEGVFAAAGLPLLRVPVRAGYDPEELGRALREAIVHAPSSTRADPPAASVSSANPPACPKCGMAMVQRVTKRGAKAGETFFGCRGYPRCHGMVTI